MEEQRQKNYEVFLKGTVKEKEKSTWYQFEDSEEVKGANENVDTEKKHKNKNKKKAIKNVLNLDSEEVKGANENIDKEKKHKNKNKKKIKNVQNLDSENEIDEENEELNRWCDEYSDSEINTQYKSLTDQLENILQKNNAKIEGKKKNKKHASENLPDCELENEDQNISKQKLKKLKQDITNVEADIEKCNLSKKKNKQNRLDNWDITDKVGNSNELIVKNDKRKRQREDSESVNEKCEQIPTVSQVPPEKLKKKSERENDAKKEETTKETNLEKKIKKQKYKTDKDELVNVVKNKDNSHDNQMVEIKQNKSVNVENSNDKKRKRQLEDSDSMIEKYEQTPTISQVLSEKSKKKNKREIDTKKEETEKESNLKKNKKKQKHKADKDQLINVVKSKDNSVENENKSANVANSNNLKAKKRKPVSENTVIMVDGEASEITQFDGFPILSKDAERLKQLRKDLISKGIQRSEVVRTMKLERRRAEKNLARIKRKQCFHCRKVGHSLAECPDLNKSENANMPSSGICFKCGSTEHTQFACKVVKTQDFKFAQCFICKEQGHISRQCPDNPRGIYPKGGACRECGDVTHLKKDCPKLMQTKEDTSMKLDMMETGNVEGISKKPKTINMSSAVKRVKF